MATTTPERWKKIEALYHASLETDGEERQALLSRSDPEVKRAVEALLLHDPSDEGVLDRPAWELGTQLLELPREKLADGELLGPYRVDAWIGSGGMGDVYRATDLRLNRIVAIKVSTAQFSVRFEREARTIAALNHPNICQIYDIGPNYLVMEYILGSPVVSPEQEPLTRDKALRIALQIAAAIEAAHAKGIVHRDLKPANILVTDDGLVKLLDFGIAKQNLALGSANKTASVTHIGMIMGTPAYMSPEQAEGGSTDVRSDLFSFGAILYEMLAGKRAFPGASVASTLGAVMHRNPDALAAPPELRAIVLKCLEKLPGDRFQTATDLKLALERPPPPKDSLGVGWLTPRRSAVGAGSVVLIIIAAIGLYVWQRNQAGSINSIAVLPLDIQSNDTDADYIADGIAESINNRLARIPGMKVIPNSVALQYKGHAADFQKIGNTLGIDAVLSGRAILRGDEVTINIELNDVRRGTQLWGQRYTRKVAELLTVQNDISREVSQRLRSQLSVKEQQNIASGTTENPEAYQLFLKGEYYTGKFTQEGFRKGIDYLNRAIALDPRYAQAHSALANNYINQDDWFLSPADSAPKARAAALKALSFEETDVQAHVVLGIENDWYEWDYGASDREFRRALELDPDSSDARGYYSWFLPSMGRNDEAVEQARQQTQAAPLSTGANGNLGSVLVFTHRWDEAITQLRTAIDLNPNYWFDYYFLGRALEQKGQLPAAIETLQQGLKLEDNTELWGALGHAYAVSGKTAEAQQVIAHLEEMSKVRYVAPYNVALIHLGLGDKDAAFAWLERAYTARSYLLAIYLNTDARLDSLHSDPRYEDLRRRMKLPAPG